MERYKARLVAKGYNQTEDIDFFDTFVHVVKLTTVRLLLAIASCQNWMLHQLDVNNAFLHGDLDEEVYMNIPPGNNKIELNRVKQYLNDKIKIKDLGSLKYFLGLEIARAKNGITICQRKYALNILNDTGFLDSKHVPTPIVKTTKLHKDDSSSYINPSLYRRLVGRLLYLTNIRPNIGFAVQQLSQFMAQPTNLHYKALYRVLRYIKRSPGQGLYYPNSSVIKLKAFSDSDWVACIDSRKSITSCCVFLGDSLVSWKAKK
ncbi:PREDICTED: uncharacterized protein LOC109334007 [Lupinus angustifolius]|uniref:uncharacterized protein LOC109334007 n=1 Tax=Lupinus angustifolius TaxID=3871 RepID=UPI00092E627F|nr:PREDICTED: uncharacterized protein LOC109334007 [Lupinus angustifolius]